MRTKQSISLLLNKERKKDSYEESKRILLRTKEMWNSNSVLNEKEGGGTRVCEDSRVPSTHVGAKFPGRVAEPQMRHVG